MIGLATEAGGSGSGANLVATSLDDYEALKSKYNKAESNIAELKRLGATVLHGVDVKKMKLQSDLKNRKFDRIVFNFPHAGFTGKEDDMHMIRELVQGFFHNTVWLLRPSCEIHISHKIGRAYNKWDLEGLASGASLVLVGKVPFRHEDYPGYNQKRGEGARCDEPFNLGTCFTFKFQIGCSKDQYDMNGYMSSSISSIGMMAPATKRWPFHLPPPAETWPWEHLCSPINIVHKWMTLEPYGAAERQHLDFPLNIDRTGSGLYFHRQGNARAMLTTPGPSLNDFPEPSDIPRPMGRIPSPDFLSLYLRSLGVNRQRQQSLQRDYEMQGQVIPRVGETSLVQIAQLEHQWLKHLREQNGIVGEGALEVYLCVDRIEKLGAFGSHMCSISQIRRHKPARQSRGVLVAPSECDNKYHNAPVVVSSLLRHRVDGDITVFVTAGLRISVTYKHMCP